MNAVTDSAETVGLLQQIEIGEAEAFDALMRRHLPDIKRSVQRRLKPQMRPRVDPSDVIQETQHEVFSRMDDFLKRRPMSFRLWLLRTAHERLLDTERTHLRAAKRTADREVPLPDASSMQLAARFCQGSHSPSNEASRRELAAKVRRSLARMSELDREVLMLRCFEGLSNMETASLLEVNPETTKKRFARALLRLQQLLRGAGVTEAGP